MTDVLHLAWRYLSHHRYKTLILVLSIALIVYIPTGLRVLVRQSAAQLTARAEATPLLLGARGSPLELALSFLYFASETPELIPSGEADRVGETGLALPIPVSVRFRSREDPIVATTLDYFDFRGLRIESGRQIARLGDCVVGAEVARRRGIEPGDTVVSSPENVFDLAGVYPLKMRVTGVLAFAESPDDDAVFVDLRTGWVIEGLAHGHQDLTRPGAAGTVLRREGNRITANASVIEYTEITDQNIDSFHFHGDVAAFPITAIIAVPPDAKSEAILRGRYESGEATLQIVRPITIIDDLLATILTVQSFVVAALAIVAAATLATAGLVFLLSLRLRRREIETMIKIGGARARVAGVLAGEIVVVLVLGVGLAGALTGATAWFGSELIRGLLLR